MDRKLDIVDFLASGDFAGIKPGASKERVVQVIGEPLGWTNSTSGEEEVGFWKSDMWGYGNWVLFFEGEKLDAITGSELDSESRAYATFEQLWKKSIDKLILEEITNFLGSMGIDYYLAPKKLKYFKRSTQEVFEKRRRLACETLYVGNQLLGRITFTDDLRVSQIAYPCGVLSQVVGLDVNERWAKKGIELVR